MPSGEASFLSIHHFACVIHLLATRIDNRFRPPFARVVRPLETRIHKPPRLGAMWDFTRILVVFRLEVFFVAPHTRFFGQCVGEKWVKKFGERANFLGCGILE